MADYATVKAAAKASFLANFADYFSEAEADQMAAPIADAVVAGNGGGGAKKILYGAQYPSTAQNASTYPFTYWVSFFDYSYFYANTTYSTEAARQLPIPGPGNIVKVFVKTSVSAHVNTKTSPTDFQLRMNGADVSGASFQVPAGAPADTIYEAAGSWPYNDGDQMCLRCIPNSAGNLYVKSVGLVVEV